MADQNYEVGLRISTTSADSGIVQSERAMMQLGVQTEKTTGILTHLKEAAVGAGAALLSAFGAYKVISWLLEGARAAMEQARALSQLSNMARQFGQDGPAAAKAARALADALQAKGFQSDVILASVREMMPITRDYAEAISAVTLAADINVRTGMRYAEALEIIKRLIAGDRGVLYAHRELQIAATDAQGALEELRSTFGGSAAALDDAKQKVDAFHAAWQDLSKDIGGPIASVIVWIIDKIRLLASTWTAVNLALLDFSGELKLIFGGISTLLSKFDIKHPVDSIKTALALIHEEEVKFQEESKARWDAWAADVERAKAGIPGPGAPGRITAHPIAGKIPLVPGGTLDAAKAYQDSLAKQLRALMDYYTKVDKLRDEDVKAERDAHWSAFKAAQDYDIKKRQIKEAELELARRIAAAEMEAQRAAVEGTIGMLMAAFPQSREIAAAQALINTYEAVTKALTAGPYIGPILAAITLAAGLAQVANIYATEPGGGGGAAGSRPGSAFGPPIAVTGAGAPATPPPGSVSTTTVTTNAPATTIVNVNALDTTDALRAAQRALRPAGRAYDRTLVGRGSVVVGTKRPR